MRFAWTAIALEYTSAVKGVLVWVSTSGLSRRGTMSGGRSRNHWTHFAHRLDQVAHTNELDSWVGDWMVDIPSRRGMTLLWISWQHAVRCTKHVS